MLKCMAFFFGIDFPYNSAWFAWFGLSKTGRHLPSSSRCLRMLTLNSDRWGWDPMGCRKPPKKWGGFVVSYPWN